MRSRHVLKQDRPRIPVERTVTDNVLDGLAFAALLASWTIVLASWSTLPESVPRHFDLHGNPNAWGPRGLLFLLPGIGTLLFFGLIAVGRIPHTYNYPWPITPENAAVQYTRARRFIQVLGALIQGLFTGIVYDSVRLATGGEGSLIPVLTPLFLLAIFCLILGYLILGRRSPTHQGGSP